MCGLDRHLHDAGELPPFAHGRHLFMHNGQVGGYARIKRRLEAMIPDDLYEARAGTTDSEAIFLAALANGLAERPVEAMARTLKSVRALMEEAGVEEPLRFTASYTDGESLHAYRWACDGRPPTLYFRERDGTCSSSPSPSTAARRTGGRSKGCCLVARRGSPASVECLDEAMSRLAA